MTRLELLEFIYQLCQTEGVELETIKYWMQKLEAMG